MGLLSNASLNEKSGTLKDIKIYYHLLKKDKKIIAFGDIKIEKHKVHHRKNLILLEDVDIKKYRYLVWFLQAKKNY